MALLQAGRFLADFHGIISRPSHASHQLATLFAEGDQLALADYVTWRRILDRLRFGMGASAWVAAGGTTDPMLPA